MGEGDSAYYTDNCAGCVELWGHEQDSLGAEGNIFEGSVKSAKEQVRFCCPVSLNGYKLSCGELVHLI